MHDEAIVHDEAILQDGTINALETQHDGNDREFREEASEQYKPSRLEWAELVVLSAASIAMISTSLGIKKVVVHIDNIPHFTQVKGTVIAIVGTIMHALIGSLVIRSGVLTLLWMMSLFKGVRFALLYNVIAGVGWSRLMYCFKNGNHVGILVWILLGFGSAAAAIITGSIFKDTTCISPMSITTPAASYWHQIAGGTSLNNSLINGAEAAIMAMGSISNRLDSPGIIYNETTNSTIALRPLQHPEVFRNMTTVSGLEAISTSVSCNLSLSTDIVATYSFRPPVPVNVGATQQILQIKSGDYVFNISIQGNGPPRFTWINITDYSANDTYHSVTRTLSIINDAAYQSIWLDGLPQDDPGRNLSITAFPNATTYITVHLVIASCDVVARPVLTGDLLSLLDTSPSSGSKNWWLIADAKDVMAGLTWSSEYMRARSSAGITAPGLLQDISTGYAFAKSPCSGLRDCIQQLHSRTFASVLQNGAVPLVYDPQSYQGTINMTCPISIDVSLAVLATGIICICRSISLGVEYITRLIKHKRGPMVSILELCNHNLTFLSTDMRTLPKNTDEGEILDAVGNTKLRG